MDIYSKRRAGRIAAIRIPKKGLTDFQEDAGRTVELPGGLGGADRLEADSGNRSVCASPVLGLEQRAAASERSDPEMLDDLLRGSQMRSGEQKRAQSTPSECAGDANRTQGQDVRGGGMVRVVISKQQLSKLLAEGSIKKSASCKALLPPAAKLQSNGQCDMALLISNAMTLTRSPGSPWSPRLDTIVEAPVQLTRSPVITRNCKEVEHLLQTKM